LFLLLVLLKVCIENPENDPLENVFNYQLKRTATRLVLVLLARYLLLLLVLAILCYIVFRVDALDAGNSILSPAASFQVGKVRPTLTGGEWDPAAEKLSVSARRRDGEFASRRSHRGPSLGVGVVIGTLLPETTSSSPTAASPVSFGIRMERLGAFEAVEPVLLFSTSCQWTSARPTLSRQQRLSGVPKLRGVSTVLGHRIRAKIHGMHSWRRDGRSRVSRGVIPDRRTVADTGIAEHGHWRRRYISG
jgi:hypothetical protein